MSMLWVLAICAVVLMVVGRTYARFLARALGEDPTRTTPAIRRADGRDYVATPTAVVFAHHFASIAGAGPIVGPVLAVVFGWLPALLWVMVGGLFIGAAHDYLATYMATREDGVSVASIARRLLGRGAFVGFVLFLILMLSLVCGAFLNLSATALASMLPFDRLGLSETQTLFRTAMVGGVKQVVIGGVASMSVIVITILAPLVGWLYIKKQVAVWKCSLLAIVICGISIVVGIFCPVAIGIDAWKFALSIYVLVAAGIPVWVLLQSRDFINVHILYVGMAALLVTLAMSGGHVPDAKEMIPSMNIAQGEATLKQPIWPTMFILVACGAVSGFHALCASGTTCKQLTSEVAARRIGYYGMLLETFLAVCVIAVMVLGTKRVDYLQDVYPVGQEGNPVLGFAMAVGNVVHGVFSVPVAVGTLGGMILLEGFLVTTLDTAVRLMRYLIEEVWVTFFGKYDVFVEATAASSSEWATHEAAVAGADGLPLAPDMAERSEEARGAGVATSGVFRVMLNVLRLYWVNSGLAVGAMLALALSGGVAALWKIFATSNQLLAVLVLFLAALWLAKRGKRVWFAVLPAIFMLVTTAVSLAMLFKKFWVAGGNKPSVLWAADVLLIVLTTYLLVLGAVKAMRWRREKGRS